MTTRFFSTFMPFFPLSGARSTAARQLGALLTAAMLCLVAGTPAFAEPTAAAQQAQTVNINQASAAEFAELDGVGQSKAQAIVEFREANGAFASIDQLTEVKGIGPATIAKNKARLSL